MGQTKKQSEKSVTPVNLTTEQLRHLPRPREGFLEFAEPLLELYQANEAELSVKGQAPAEALEELRQYQALLLQEADLKKQLQVVQEARALHGSNVWTTILNVYARAVSAARTDAVMRRAIAGFAHFMKAVRKKKTVAPTEPVTPVVPPVTTP